MGANPNLKVEMDPRVQSTEEHVNLAIRMLKESGATDFLKAQDKMKKFCNKIANLYEAIPYHNFKHAFNVMHTTYLLILSMKSTPFTTLQVSGLLIAALCHDIKHNGRTSSFHNTVNSPIAQEYSKHRGSILEAMHASVSIQIIIEEHLLDHLNKEQSKEFKLFVHELILATDMALHPQIIQDYAEKKDALTQAKMILHCADISNPTKLPEISKWWSHSVLREFTAQVNEEKKLGLPLSNFMKADLFSFDEAKMHLGFIDAFVVPAWRLLASSTHFDSYVTIQCMKNIAKSRKMWLDMMDGINLLHTTVALDLKRKRFEDIHCSEIESSQTKSRFAKVHGMPHLETRTDCHVT